MDNIVTAEGLTKHYNSLCAVDGISFNIRRGECFGFLGPNGAGKTTAMRVLYCFLPPDGGTIKVFGMDVTEHPSEIKSRIGVMPQDDNLDPDITVIENLIVYARYFGIPKRDSLPIARRLLQEAGLKDKERVSIRKLSGGMKRSLQLARAVINDPELLVLDEPTTGLDPHVRRTVWDRLRGFMSRGVTLLLTTHYMEEAQYLCDRVAIMDRGVIVATDSPDALKQKYGGDLEHVYLQLTGRKFEA